MNQSKVYVLQHPSRQNVPLDISDAARYGNLQRPVFPPTYNAILDATDVVRKLEQALYDYEEGDYIIAIGDPAIIGVATAIAARNSGGVVNLLKWNRAFVRGKRDVTHGSYVPLTIELDI